ncbi:MAG: hypothetical protein ACE5GN_05070 [Waddliaceae bacterium]
MTSTFSESSDLAERVYNLVKRYVNRKTEGKSGMKRSDFKDKKQVDPSTGKERIEIPPKYREAREKVCMDAFLRLRACRAREDFVSYFIGSICSVPQYLPDVEYQAISKAILDEKQWEDIKALAMLALSGSS